VEGGKDGKSFKDYLWFNPRNCRTLPGSLQNKNFSGNSSKHFCNLFADLRALALKIWKKQI